MLIIKHKPRAPNPPKACTVNPTVTLLHLQCPSCLHYINYLMGTITNYKSKHCVRIKPGIFDFNNNKHTHLVSNLFLFGNSFLIKTLKKKWK